MEVICLTKAWYPVLGRAKLRVLLIWTLIAIGQLTALPSVLICSSWEWWKCVIKLDTTQSAAALTFRIECLTCVQTLLCLKQGGAEWEGSGEGKKD